MHRIGKNVMSVGAFIGLIFFLVFLSMSTEFLKLPRSKDWRHDLSQPRVRAGKFTAAAAQAIEELHPGTDVRILAPLKLQVQPPGGAKTGELDLRPLFEAVGPIPGSRAVETERYLRHELALRHPLQGNRPIALAHVTPLVRTWDFLARSRENGPEPWSRPLAGPLVICLAEDRGDSLAYLTRDQILRLGGTEEATYRVALNNLAALPQKPKRVSIGQVQALEWAAGEPAPLLLRDDLWTAAATGLPGQVIAAVPSRDLLLYTSTQTPGGREALQQLVRQMAAQEKAPSSRELSRNLLLRGENGAWTVLE
jgi:uncharacterized protein YtpQ (UPF0354 family)